MNQHDNLEQYAGVRFDKDRIFALDGYRAAINNAGIDGLHVDTRFQMSVPTLDLLPLFGDEMVMLKVGKERILIEGPGYHLDAKLLFCPKFDIDSAIPRDAVDKYEVPLERYSRCISYLNEFAKGKMCPYVTFDSGRCSVPTGDRSGLAEVDLGIRKQGPSIRFGFDGRYMKECLQQFRGCGTITIKVTGPLSPIVITDGSCNLALVVPCRLKDQAA